MSTENQPTIYVLRFCGVSNGNPGPAGAAAILHGEDKTVLYRFRWGLGHQTVIAAEYHSLILGMRHAIMKGYKNIIAEGDSLRVVSQVKGFESAHEPIRSLWIEVKELKERFHAFHIQLIPRVENSLAEAHAKQAVNLEESEVQEDCMI